MSEITPTSLAQALSISVSYASQMLSGARGMSRDRAIRAFEVLGVKLGPIASATDAEIAVLAKFQDRSPVMSKGQAHGSAPIDDSVTVAPDAASGAGAKTAIVQ